MVLRRGGGDAQSIKGKIVDESARADGKYIKYQTSGDKHVYDSPSGVGDMLKSIYDTDADDLVDNSDQLDGYDATAFAKVADLATITALWTFNRGALPPFAVDVLSTKVSYLDADLIDGLHLPNTIANLLIDHTKAVHDALALDADTLDTKHYSDISTEIDNDISTHAGIASAHHAQDHKASHISGGADAFTSTDLLEAVVKRIQTSTGPTDLTVGAIADGEYLKRSGSTIIGGTPAGGAADPEATMDLIDDFVGGTTENGEVGELGWASASGVHSVQNGEAGHPGIFRFQSGTTQDSFAYRMTLGTSGRPIDETDKWDITIIARLESVADVRYILGLKYDMSSSSETHCAMFRFDTDTDTNWICVSADGTTAETTDSGVAATALTWIKFRVVYDGTDIKFYIDDVLKATHTTRFPGVQLFPGWQVVPRTTTAKYVEVDFARVKVTGLGR